MAIVHNDNLTPWKAQPLCTNETALNAGYTHMAVINANNLTVTATNTLQTFTVMTLKAGDMIGKIMWRCKTFFQDVSDIAYNNNTMSVGFTADVAGFIAAIQVNVNGTEVKQGITNTLVHFTAADIVSVTFNSMAAKALNDIDAGEVEFFIQLIRPSVLESAKAATPITK